METPKFIIDLLAEVETMDANAFRPAHKVEQPENKIGDCTDYEKRLYALSKMYSKLRDQHKVEAKYHTVEEGCTNEHGARIEEYNTKASIYERLLWAAIDARLDLWGGEKQYGVRAGWEIIEAERGPNDLPPGLKGFIAKLGEE